jgi:dihydroorotase
MPDTYDLILKGGTVVNHDGEGVRDIGIADGRIMALGQLARASASEVIDCNGLHILPGVIDTQVHFRDPGLTHKEDLESGSRGAVLGGVTAVFEMPNTNPATTNAASLADKISRGRHHMHCDFAFFMGGPISSGCPAAPASRCSSVHPLARCWWKTTTACAGS